MVTRWDIIKGEDSPTETKDSAILHHRHCLAGNCEFGLSCLSIHAETTAVALTDRDNLPPGVEYWFRFDVFDL